MLKYFSMSCIIPQYAACHGKNVYSSHVLSDVEAISNRVGIIIDGKMRREGPIADVMAEAGSLEEALTEEIARA